jgi:4-hydroxymandelate oxidase
VLSTRSTQKIEDVAAACSDEGGTWWFQVYLMRDRELTIRLVRRVAAAGAQALVLTADTPVVGRKRRNEREIVSDADFLVNLGQVADPDAAMLASDLSFADIGWLAEISGGLPVVVKGVLRPDDATACMAYGAAGVVVSNHGGRQLDGAVPTAWALPGVAAAVREPPAGSVPADGLVGVDGGIRAGQDALAALALGAQLVFLGRPALWALTCGGADGVQALLEGFTSDLEHVMALAGASRLAELAGLAVAALPAGPAPPTGPPLPGTHSRHTVGW